MVQRAAQAANLTKSAVSVARVDGPQVGIDPLAYL